MNITIYRIANDQIYSVEYTEIVQNLINGARLELQKYCKSGAVMGEKIKQETPCRDELINVLNNSISSPKFQILKTDYFTYLDLDW